MPRPAPLRSVEGMMHSTVSTTLRTTPGRRIPALGAALLAVAGNILVVTILAVAALVVVGAAAYVFGAGLLEAL